MSAVDQVLALSDERDLWRKFAIELANESYDAGYADGQADTRREQDRVWAARPPVPYKIGPTFAELETRRAETARTFIRRLKAHRVYTQPTGER